MSSNERNEPFDGLTISDHFFEYPEFQSIEHAVAVVRRIQATGVARIWREFLATHPSPTREEQFELAQRVALADFRDREADDEPILLSLLMVEAGREWSPALATEASETMRNASGAGANGKSILALSYAAHMLGLMNVSDDRHAIARLATLGGEVIDPEELLFASPSTKP